MNRPGDVFEFEYDNQAETFLFDYDRSAFLMPEGFELRRGQNLRFLIPSRWTTGDGHPVLLSSGGAAGLPGAPRWIFRGATADLYIQPPVRRRG